MQTRPETRAREAAHVFLCGRFASKRFEVCPCVSDLFHHRGLEFLAGGLEIISVLLLGKRDMGGALIAFNLVPAGGNKCFLGK